jgi:hypothetical protein
VPIFSAPSERCSRVEGPAEQDTECRENVSAVLRQKMRHGGLRIPSLSTKIDALSESRRDDAKCVPIFSAPSERCSRVEGPAEQDTECRENVSTVLRQKVRHGGH